MAWVPMMLWRSGSQSCLCDSSEHLGYIHLHALEICPTRGQVNVMYAIYYAHFRLLD